MQLTVEEPVALPVVEGLEVVVDDAVSIRVSVRVAEEVRVGVLVTGMDLAKVRRSKANKPELGHKRKHRKLTQHRK